MNIVTRLEVLERSDPETSLSEEKTIELEGTLREQVEALIRDKTHIYDVTESYAELGHSVEDLMDKHTNSHIFEYPFPPGLYLPFSHSSGDLSVSKALEPPVASIFGLAEDHKFHFGEVELSHYARLSQRSRSKRTETAQLRCALYQLGSDSPQMIIGQRVSTIFDPGGMNCYAFADTSRCGTTASTYDTAASTCDTRCGTVKLYRRFVLGPEG